MNLNLIWWWILRHSDQGFKNIYIITYRTYDDKETIYIRYKYKILHSGITEMRTPQFLHRSLFWKMFLFFSLLYILQFLIFSAQKYYKPIHTNNRHSRLLMIIYYLKKPSRIGENGPLLIFLPKLIACSFFIG